MSRALIVVRHSGDRMRAQELAEKVPLGSRIEFKASKRSLPQNAKMWAMLTDISRQLVWHGQKLRPDDWKLVFMDALKRECRFVPAIDGKGFVNLGRSSSDYSKEEMSDLIEIMNAFGAQHGVKFQDEEQAA